MCGIPVLLKSCERKRVGSVCEAAVKFGSRSTFLNGEYFHSFATNWAYFIPIETIRQDFESSFRRASRKGVEREICCFLFLGNYKVGQLGSRAPREKFVFLI